MKVLDGQNEEVQLKNMDEGVADIRKLARDGSDKQEEVKDEAKQD